MADAVIEALKQKFDDFLESYYKEQIGDLVIAFPESKSLKVDITDLQKFDPELTSELIERPDLVLEAANESLKGKLGETVSEGNEVHVRFYNLNINNPLVQDVGADYIGRMVSLDTLSVKRSEIIPKVKIGTYKCTYCGNVMKVRIGTDPVSDICGQCKRRSMKQDPTESEFINLQKIAVQDPLEKLRGNSPTWQLEVWLEDDLVNTIIPGDRIQITGVLRIRPRRNKRGKEETSMYTMYLDTVSTVPRQKEFAEIEISEEEERQIMELAKDPRAFEKISDSIVPSIYGHNEIKQAVVLQLFGGTPGKLLVDGGLIRSDVHMLLIGDPGSAKTRVLQSVATMVPKGIYVSGKSVTGGGMTAVAERDDFSEGGWTLKAGAMVLGNGGVVCVTENTEIYDGQRLTTIGALWDSTNSKVYPTKHDMEGKNLSTPVSIYDTEARVDRYGHSFAILRRRYVGEIVKLTLASGLTLEVTPDHKLKRLTNVKNLWIQAGDVKPGQKLRAPVRIFGPTATLNFSEDDSYVLGCIYGDGHIRSDSVVISQSKVNRDIIDRIMRRSHVFSLYDKKDRLRELHGRDGKAYTLVSRMYQMWTANKEFVDRVNFFLKRPSIDNVLMLDDRSLAAFMGGVFDTDGDLNVVSGRVVAARMYPTKSVHELKVMLYALRRLGIYARIHDLRGKIPIIQITGSDVTLFSELIRPYSVKINRKKTTEVKHNRNSLVRGEEKVVKVERFNYDGYVYDLSVAKRHNYEVSLVYIHNCIDEFDKLGDEDRAALHEALESQTISVAKAGIIATFNARTAVLAAANPKFGRFDPNMYPADQFDIPPTLLSRFDLIFPVKDIMDEDLDTNIAKHILVQHEAAGAKLAQISEYEQVEKPPIDKELLRKYIAYAKTNVRPRLGKEASNRIQEYYVELRKMGKRQGATPITPRQIEGLIRLAEASAKSRLAEEVELSDAERAIGLTEFMFKTLSMDSSGRRDIDVILTGMPKEKVDRLNMLLNIIKDLEEKEGYAGSKQLYEEAGKAGISSDLVNRYVKELERSGDIYMPKAGMYKTVRHEAE